MGEGDDALRSKRRATGRVVVLPFHRKLQQARTAKTLNRIDCHGLPLKNPARYGNSQRRIAKVPDSHNSLPTPEPTLGSKYGVPS
jgi:hypothetical protein